MNEMKNILVILILTIVPIVCYADAVQISDSLERIGKLDNGLTYYIRHNEKPEHRADFYIVHKVGSVLEKDYERGLAHFLEHMAFEDTEHFPDNSIIPYMESVGVRYGSNLNAGTSFDYTEYELSDVPTDRTGIIDTALLILRDWSHGITLKDDKIEEERGVIMEEWRSGNDWSDRMWESRNLQLYSNTPYARNIIGDTSVIKNFHPDTLRSFYNKWYSPDLQAVIIVGDINPDSIENKIKALWQDIPFRKTDRPYFRIPLRDKPVVALATDPEFNDNGAFIIEIVQDSLFRHYPKKTFDNQATWALYDMLAEIFNQRIRDENTYNTNTPVDGSVSMSAGDIWDQLPIISLRAESKLGREEESFRYMLTAIEKLVRDGITPQELELRKTNWLESHKQEYTDRNDRENWFFRYDYLFHFLYDMYIFDIEKDYEAITTYIKGLTIDDFNQIIKQLTSNSHVEISYYYPADERVWKPTKEELYDLYVNRQDFLSKDSGAAGGTIDTVLVKMKPKRGRIKKCVENEVLQTTEITLSNGVRVIVKETDFATDEIGIYAYSKGGYSIMDTISHLPSAYACNSLWNYTGLGEMNKIQLRKFLLDKHCGYGTTINQYDEDVTAWSNKRDFETALQMVNRVFAPKTISDEAFRYRITNWIESTKMKKTSPDDVFGDSVYLIGNDYHERCILWNDSIQYKKIDKNAAERFVNERFTNPADFTFFIVGNINPKDKKTKELLCRWLGGMKTSSDRERFIDRGFRMPKGQNTHLFYYPMETEKTKYRMTYWKEMSTNTFKHNLTIKLLTMILDTRYNESVREKEGAAYSIYVWGAGYTIPVPTTYLTVSFETDPQKDSVVLPMVEREIRQILDNGPLESDLEKSKSILLKEYEENIKKNWYWRYTILPQYYLYDRNYITDYVSTVESITIEDIQSTLSDFLKDAHRYEIIMKPDSNNQN